MAAPRTSLTSVKRPFTWTPKADAAFWSLREWFTSALILQVPDPSLQFVLEVDASDIGVGGCPVSESRIAPEASSQRFLLPQLIPAERYYDIGNHELIMVKLALEEL